MNTKKPKDQNQKKTANPLEALKEVSNATAKQMKQEAARLPEDFFNQLMGYAPAPKNYTGEIGRGETLEMRDVFSGKFEQMQKERAKMSFERRLMQEEQSMSNQKTQELKMQLNNIQQELLMVAKNTQNLAEEVQVAVMTSAVDPGVYHIVFFEKLLAFIKSFRAKINQASEWLYAVNKRAGKKNMWGQNYKKHGAKYLLSSEHYLQRSAG
jgi:Domain of unknown function (DUF5660)